MPNNYRNTNGKFKLTRISNQINLSIVAQLEPFMGNTKGYKWRAVIAPTAKAYPGIEGDEVQVVFQA